MQRRVETGRIAVGEDGKIDFVEATAAIEATRDPAPITASYWDAKKQTEYARGQLLALQLARERGDVIDRKRAEARWEHFMRTLSDIVMAMPDRLVPLIRAAKSDAEARALLGNELRAALRSSVGL